MSNLGYLSEGNVSQGHGGGWIGPTLILGTAVAIVATERRREEPRVIIHERRYEPAYKDIASYKIL